jgi:hypothetical protein
MRGIFLVLLLASLSPALAKDKEPRERSERANTYREMSGEVRSPGGLSRAGAQAVTMDNIREKKAKEK